jgi:glucose-1-phosphate cytidylyltransferase
VKVVILCGGLGTRLKEETEYRPKPLVEVGGRPILWHIMKVFAHYGLSEFVLCLGYRGNMIKEYFLNYEAMNSNFTITPGKQSHVPYHGAHKEQNFNVTLVDTGLETMTGGRVKRIAQFIDGDDFIVTYGDGVANIDIGALVTFHKKHGRIATVTAVKPRSRFGVLEIDSSGSVQRFLEKPCLDGWVSAGFFVFNRRVLDYIDGDECILEREPIMRLTREDELRAYRHDSFFFAMDTYRDYKQLVEIWDSGKAPWKVWDTP